MGKSTNSMVIFNSKLLVDQRVSGQNDDFHPWKKGRTPALRQPHIHCYVVLLHSDRMSGASQDGDPIPILPAMSTYETATSFIQIHTRKYIAYPMLYQLIIPPSFLVKSPCLLVHSPFPFLKSLPHSRPPHRRCGARPP